MRDEVAQDHTCAICGSPMSPFNDDHGEVADFRQENEAGRDRWICPACNTYLLYMEGSEDES